ncbi:MAG: ribulose-phosphate 3-epimerase [Lachnospiraceae bacterium]|nr:ribulose-phosphate 3-epimerase [Lachnospiraceae bacterium]
MYQLAPSMLSADFNRLGEQLQEIEKAGNEWLHVDVMDGEFVPSISFGMPVIASIRKESNLFFDVHLMITEPIRYIQEFADCGADMLTIHVEACEDVARTIEKIRECGCKVGITLNPGTPLAEITPFLELVDMVLIMSVNPGFGGQKYIESSTGKIAELREILDEKKLHVDIEVDGGINDETLPIVLDAGANIIVAGSAVFHGDIAANVRKFNKALHK